MSDYQNDATKAVKATANIPNFGYHGELPIGETYAFTIARHRDSGLLDVSNWEVITADMAKRFPDDCETVHCGHWAVGWIDHFAVRMLDEQGEVTPAGVAILEWQGALETYPVASDDDYSEREYTATIANIESEVSRLEFAREVEPGALAGLLFGWFGDHNQGAIESRDDQGGCPSDDEIREACEALGYAIVD